MDYPVGDLLKDLRSRKGYTQEYVSSHIGVSRQAYSAYENGTTDPSISVIFGLIDLYQIDIMGIIRRGTQSDKREEGVVNSYKLLEANMIDCMRKVPHEIQRQMYDYAIYLATRYLSENKRKYS